MPNDVRPPAPRFVIASPRPLGNAEAWDDDDLADEPTESRARRVVERVSLPTVNRKSAKDPGRVFVMNFRNEDR